MVQRREGLAAFPGKEIKRKTREHQTREDGVSVESEPKPVSLRAFVDVVMLRSGMDESMTEIATARKWFLKSCRERKQHYDQQSTLCFRVQKFYLKNWKLQNYQQYGKCIDAEHVVGQ